MLRIISFIFWIFLSLSSTVAAQNSSKIKPEDIVAKHLDSIGTAETLAAANNRLFEGKSQARVTQSSIITVQGKSLLASTADSNLIQMMFEAVSASDYSREQISFDGKKLNIPFNTESQRSALGDFVFNYPEIVKQSLLGGTLFSSWALTNKENKLSKLQYVGKDKIAGKQVVVLRVLPRGGSSLNIKLYFDAQTFRHLRTVYYRIFTPQGVISDDVSWRQSETRYELVEDFSDYKQINGLNLPTAYKITYTIETQTIARQFEWLLKFSRFSFNQKMQADMFR